MALGFQIWRNDPLPLLFLYEDDGGPQSRHAHQILLEGIGDLSQLTEFVRVKQHFKNDFGDTPGTPAAAFLNEFNTGGLYDVSTLTFPATTGTKHPDENAANPAIWAASTFKNLWDPGLGPIGPF
ncbi:hypothetical protein BJX63DRAFT_429574 [Aspergillus granulosus]|uniref:Uncharacterized protein n=1 Tax=Aspergillus granulosus TaxID=176169 RepID=A0ABR4HQW5_9EURO